MTHLLDSDWLADYLRGRITARRVLSPLIKQGSLATSIIVYAEIYEGLLAANPTDVHYEAFARFVAGVPVLPLDQKIAQVFAEHRAALRSRGLLIPDHDLWIAATALHHGLILVTRNLKDFRRVPDLKLLQLGQEAD